MAVSGVTPLLRAVARAPVLIVLVLVALASAIGNEEFLTAGNLFNLLRQLAPLGIVATGMTLVLIVGGIDLSVGAVVSLAGILVIAVQPVLGSAMGVAAALAAGLAVGLVNSGIVTALRINPFIGTLGTMTAVRGLALTLSDSQTLPGTDPAFAGLADWPVLGIPLSAIVFAALLLAGHHLLSATPAGRGLYAAGGNAAAARLAGLSVGRHACLAYTLCALAAAISGVLIASQINAGSPIIGDETPLYAIAAALLGSISMRGGAGTLPGTLQGVLTLGILQNGLNLHGVGGQYQIATIGGLLIATMMLDEALGRRNALR